MGSAGIVESIEEVTAAWLTAALAGAGVVASVMDVDAAPIGTGQMGSCFRLSLDYSDGSGPQRLVVKLPATDPEARSAGTLGYRCETSFYREVADRVSVRYPRCYFGEVNDRGDTLRLLLEDLDPKSRATRSQGARSRRPRRPR